ncbi:uncharacterized protein RJT20DRAFT_132847 [Scheffersomyces xylosifermentans]|uniref:uncharacterized protein n=1 Tax=Scheffersomyces xylosifermentans TaxID=1304137 RepID=UPI00315D171E
MVISTRVSLQWPPEAPEELSHTMAFTSPGNNYVDVRIFKDKYPYKQTKGARIPHFEDVFQWCLAGEEQPIPNSGKIRFVNHIDTLAISKSLRTGKPLELGEDVGDFSIIEGSEDRKETGVMVNPDTNKVQNYVEIWRSLDPIGHTPTSEVREPKNEIEHIEVYALETVNSDKYLGKVLRLGNWVQGILYDKSNEDVPIHVIRAFYNLQEKTWESLIEYGNVEWFPFPFQGKLGDVVDIEGSDIQWKCIEHM